MVLEDRSYQPQYFTKIFSSPLTLALRIHFYLHFQESSSNTLWTVITLKSSTFSATERAPETALESTYFMLFLKNLTKNLEKKLMIKFALIDQSYKFFFFMHAISSVIEENSQAMHGWKKIVFTNPQLYFFPWNTSDYLCLLKIIVRLFLFSNIFIKP